MAINPIPPGYHTATPYLIVNGGVKALDFYQRAFGATVLMRLDMPDEKIGHAEIKIGDSPIMLADACPEMEFSDPQALGGTPVSILLYVDNVDDAFARAIEAGGEVVKPLRNQFYGDRSGTLKDPFGHVWTIASHVEDVPEEELNRRIQEMMSQPAGS